MSSLLRRGPHQVTVIPVEETTDKLGVTTRDGSPVTVTSVMIQPLSTTPTDQTDNDPGHSLWRVIGPGTWPGGACSRVRVDTGPPGLTGRDLDQVGEALQRSCGHRTAHFTVTLRSRGRQVR